MRRVPGYPLRRRLNISSTLCASRSGLRREAGSCVATPEGLHWSDLIRFRDRTRSQPATLVCEETPPPEMAMWTGVSSAPVSVRAPNTVFEDAPVVRSARSRPSADESPTRIIFSFQSCVPYFECSRFGIEPWSLPDKLSERYKNQTGVAGVRTTVNDAMRPSARAEKRSAARRTGFRPWLTQTPSASREPSAKRDFKVSTAKSASPISPKRRVKNSCGDTSSRSSVLRSWTRTTASG